MEQKIPFKMDPYALLTFLWRRKWLIIFLFIPIFALAEVHVLRSPKIYRASVTLSIVPQRVPASYVRSTVSGDMEAFVHSIWQEITSRRSLEVLIREYNLYPNMVEMLPMETVVERMRKAIKVSRPRGGRRNVFIISFEYYDPKVAAKVVNRIANVFIEENLKLREEQAKTITAFLDEELKRIENQLREREKAIQEYKRKYMEELPEQKDTIISILGRLQKENEALQMRKEMLQDRKVAILEQLKNYQQGVNSEAATDTEDFSASLAQLQQKYEALLSKYTEKHPDVIRLKRLIEKKKKELQSIPFNNDSAKSSEPTIVGQLKKQLREIDSEIKKIDELYIKNKEKIALYQKRLENIPKREQELKDLARDYANLMKTYQMLLDKKIQATMAETLEKRQQGEQFKIIDPARVPEVPISPNTKKILFMGAILALAAGLGFAFVLEFFLDKKIYDPTILEAFYQTKVLIIVPKIMLPEEKRKAIAKSLFLGFIALVGLSGNIALLYLIWRNTPI